MLILYYVVPETAMDWGFLLLGRFSEQYSRLFGELPRETGFKKM